MSKSFFVNDDFAHSDLDLRSPEVVGGGTLSRVSKVAISSSSS